MKSPKLRILVIFFAILAVVFSCKKYKDPEPFTDSRINNPYCNVPSALNYNWGFPGIADNAVCLYPSGFFSGNYFYRDTLYDISGLPLGQQDSFTISITAIDTGKVNLTGFCGNNIVKATTDKYYKMRFDSTFNMGQHLCGTFDTLAGGASKKGFDDSLTMRFTYQITDASGIHYHGGTAVKQ